MIGEVEGYAGIVTHHILDKFIRTVKHLEQSFCGPRSNLSTDGTFLFSDNIDITRTRRVAFLQFYQRGYEALACAGIDIH